MKTFRLALIGVFLLVGAATGLAQDESGGFLHGFGGSFRPDGSCFLWQEGDCVEGLPEGGDGSFWGFRVGYRSSGRWSVEATVARDALGEARAVLASQGTFDPRGPGPSPFQPTLSEPVDVRLWTVGGTYSLLRRGSLDLFASAGVGAITFDENGIGDEPVSDLLTTVGGGALVHLWRIVFLRGDVRGYTQWCAEERDREELACEDGSVLGHLEATLGIQLVLHPYDF